MWLVRRLVHRRRLVQSAVHRRERVLLHAPDVLAAEQRVGARRAVRVGPDGGGGRRHRPAPRRGPRSHLMRRRLMPTRRARRGVARDGPGGELALPSLLRREFASLLQLLRGADRVIPRQHVTGAARVLLLVEEIGVVRSRRGGLGWGLPPPVPGLWAPLKVLALTGRMGCAGGCPAGLRESLLALRRGEGRVEIASGRGAWSPLLFVGVPIGSPWARKTCTDDGGFAVDARTEREHRPRARVSRRRWTERAGAGWRTAPAWGVAGDRGKGRCERSGKTPGGTKKVGIGGIRPGADTR